ncbi:hypothetical protein SXCC_03405 [Gluconacetobacter sp. SXCC-1]|nr:hypothetical protein SXCC_03405 [Gluconacetobacter sp. SXCC-1]
MSDLRQLCSPRHAGHRTALPPSRPTAGTAACSLLRYIWNLPGSCHLTKKGNGPIAE